MSQGQYPPQPYMQQPYIQQPYIQQRPVLRGPLLQPRPKKSNTGLFIGIGIAFAVVVILIIVIVVVTSGGSSDLPASGGGTGSGTGSETGSGTGSGTGSETGSGTGSGTGGGTPTPTSATYPTIGGYYKFYGQTYNVYLCSWVVGAAIATPLESNCSGGYTIFAINQDPNYATNGRVQIQSTANGYYLVPSNASYNAKSVLVQNDPGFTWKVTHPTATTPYYVFQDVTYGVYLGVCNICYGVSGWVGDTRPGYSINSPEIRWTLQKQTHA